MLVSEVIRLFRRGSGAVFNPVDRLTGVNFIEIQPLAAIWPLAGAIGPLPGVIGQLSELVGRLSGDIGRLSGSVGRLLGAVGGLTGSIRQLSGRIVQRAGSIWQPSLVVGQRAEVVGQWADGIRPAAPLFLDRQRFVGLKRFQPSRRALVERRFSVLIGFGRLMAGFG